MSSLETVMKLAEYLEAKGWESLEGLISDDFTGKGPTVEFDKQQEIEYFKILCAAFPDYSLGLTDFREEGEWVSCTNHEQGTHTGVLDLNLLGIPVSLPPTGKSFKLPPGRNTFRVVNNKIAYASSEVVEEGGMAGVFAQLGVKIH